MERPASTGGDPAEQVPGDPRNPRPGGSPDAWSTLANLVALAALAVLALGLREFGGSLAPILLALVLVVVVDPVRARLIDRGLPPWIGLLALTGVAYGILAAFTGAIIWAGTRLADYLTTADYDTRLTELQDDSARWLSDRGLSQETIDRGLQTVDLGSVNGYVVQSLTEMLSILGLVSIVVIAVALLALDATGFHRALTGTVRYHRPAVAAAFIEFARGTRRYFAVYTLFGLVVASLQVAFMWVVGVPLALVWGLLSLLASYIPNLGIIIATVPPVAVAFLEDGWVSAVVVATGLLAINQVVDSVAKPKVVGNAVGISATLTFVSLILWAWVFGAVGALLAVPLTLFMKALLVDANPDARWLGALISLTPERAPIAATGDDEGAS
ncbi:MAG: AI-2E family transporter [Thermoleophilia bacterium]